MNVKSKYDIEVDNPPEPKRKNLWLGFANPTQDGRGTKGRIMFGIWDTHAVDPILEMLGFKKKEPGKPKRD
jgi:hypothetical protein